MRFLMTLAFLSVALACPALAQEPSASAERVLAVRGGLLIDGSGAPPLPNSVILMANGKILAVGSEGTVTIPANALILDAHGKTVIPGLVDAHAHLRNNQIQDYLYWGVTSVGDLGNSPGWLVAYRDAVEQGRITGSYILAGGLRVNGPAPPGLDNPIDRFLTGNFGGATFTASDTASAEKAVLTAKALGLDAIKMISRNTPTMMKTTIALAHRQGLPVFAHFDSADVRQGQPLLGTDEIVDTGLDVHVHLFGLIKAFAPPAVIDRIRNGGPPQGWEQLDTAKFAPVIQRMVANGMFLNPTIAAHFEKASRISAEFDPINIAYLKGPMGQSMPKPIRDPYLRWLKGPQQESAVLAEGYKRAGLFVKQFAEAGGKLVAGTDSAGRGGTPGLTLHQELAMFSEIGIAPMKIIQSATSWGMQAWGKGKEAGTLEAGKRADILVLNSNPLDDVRATRDIFQVIQNGKIIDREGLATKRENIVPWPAPAVNGFVNSGLHIPIINQVLPELLIAGGENPAQLTIRGTNFTKATLVLINDHLVHPTFVGQQELRLQIPASLIKSAGVFPLAAVQTGSGGSVSNSYYLIVTQKQRAR